MMRRALPAYDELQRQLVLATTDLRVSRMLDLGAGTGETSAGCLDAHPDAVVVAVDGSAGFWDRAGGS